MLSLLVVLSFSDFPIRCKHNELIASLIEVPLQARRIAADPLEVKLEDAIESDWDTIRIDIDEYFLQEPTLDDQMVCTKVDDKVCSLPVFSNANPPTFQQCRGTVVTCTEADLLTPAKRTTIHDTLVNVQNYLVEQLDLNVQRLNATFPIFDSPCKGSILANGYKINPTRVHSKEDADYYLAIYPRPKELNSRTLATALGWQPACSGSIGRRIVWGVMNIPVANVPAQAQDWNTTGDRQFFETVLHETVHALGVSGDSFKYWWDLEGDHKPFNRNPTEWCVKDGKNFTFLTTKGLTALVEDRWGVSTVKCEGNREVHLGVELEDTGGTGTAGSHWELRTYYSELMVGITFGYGRISEVTLTALEDTGWYQFDKTKAEPLEWGDWRSIRGMTRDAMKNFPVEPPSAGANWPQHYVARSTSQLGQPTCTFDHRGFGIWNVEGQQRDCTNKTTDECAYPDFYDALRLNRYATVDTDYVVLPVLAGGTFHCRAGPISRVKDQPDHWKAEGATYGTAHSYCAMTSLTAAKDPTPLWFDTPQCYEMSCNVFDQILVNINDQTGICNAKGDELTFEGFLGRLICPDPAILCGIDRYNQSTLPFRSPDKSAEPKIPDPSPSPQPDPPAGYSYHINYEPSDTYTRKFVTITQTVIDTSVRSLTMLDGAAQWVMTFIPGYTGTVSLYTWAPTKVDIPVLTQVKIEKTLFDSISGAGWVGIVAAVIALVVFIVGVCYCQKKADQEWEKEQALYARQRRATVRGGGTTRGSGRPTGGARTRTKSKV
jgi:hypothetical protein